MQLLFFSGENGEPEEQLEAAIRSAASGLTIERFCRLTNLQERLRDIVEPNSIAVLRAGDQEQLLNLQAFNDLLTEICVIMVLPDRQMSTIQLAHLLKPQFISSFKDDFSELKQFVAKMIQLSRSCLLPKVLPEHFRHSRIAIMRRA